MTPKELKNVIAEASWYLGHLDYCEHEMTDFCNCGLREAKQALRKAWKEL